MTDLRTHDGRRAASYICAVCEKPFSAMTDAERHRYELDGPWLHPITPSVPSRVRARVFRNRFFAIAIAVMAICAVVGAII